MFKLIEPNEDRTVRTTVFATFLELLSHLAQSHYSERIPHAWAVQSADDDGGFDQNDTDHLSRSLGWAP